MLDQTWAIAFLLTEAVETPIYAVALRHFNLIPRLMLALGASLLTHPLVWLFVSARGANEYWSSVTISEIAAVLVGGGLSSGAGCPKRAWLVGFSQWFEYGRWLFVSNIWDFT